MMNKMPQGDIWNIVDGDPSSQNYNKCFKFDFSYIKMGAIKAVVKNYIWINNEKREITLSGLHTKNYKFQYFMRFAEALNIQSLRYLNSSDVESFKTYLATTLSSRTGKPLNRISQKTYFDVLKAIVAFARNDMKNDAPDAEIFPGKDYPRVTRKLSIDFIPDSIVEEIVTKLSNEQNIFIKCGVAILLSTGMRIGDLLMLKVTCIGKHPIDGGATLRYFMHKTRKNKTIKIPPQCVQAVNALIEYTASIRQDAPENLRDYLFIHLVMKGVRSGKIGAIPQRTYHKWLKAFVVDNEINDTNGEPYDLTAHQFRRTLFTDMLSKGLSFSAISKQGGVHVQTLIKYYADVKDVERGEVWQDINVIGNPDDIDERFIRDPEELIIFKANKDAGARMCDGYCSEPIKNGQICERLKKKRSCYSCRRFITTPEFLEYHKNQLQEIETELENNIYGEHYASHLRPFSEILHQIIRRLEELK